MAEYTDPNPFKSFHIGHLMPNVIGESLTRLFDNAHADVLRVNYQGDVGIHVASAIWGMKKLEIAPTDGREFGRAYALGATAYKDDESAKAEIIDPTCALFTPNERAKSGKVGAMIPKPTATKKEAKIRTPTSRGNSASGLVNLDFSLAVN